MEADSHGDGDTPYSSHATVAGELAARMSRQIDLIAASAGSVGTASKDGEDDGAYEDEDDDDEDEQEYERVGECAAGQDRMSASSSDDARPSSGGLEALKTSQPMMALQSTLSKLRSSTAPPSYGKLRATVDDAWSSEMELGLLQALAQATQAKKASSMTSGSSKPEDSLVWSVNAHLTATVLASTLETLLEQANRVKDEELYWQSIEARDRYSAVYLVQTLPVRIAHSLRVLMNRLQHLASSPRPPMRMLSYTTIKRALPPSLLLTSLFPHLSARHGSSFASASSEPTASTSQAKPSHNRSLLFLTLSPLLLTRQEVSLKRRELKNLRLHLASKIGTLVRDAESGIQDMRDLQEKNERGQDKLASLGSVMSNRIACIEHTLAGDDGADQAVETAEQQQPSYTINSPNELLLSLQQTVHKSVHHHSQRFTSRIDTLSRPSRLTRAWPWLVTVPLGTYFVISKLYNSRTSIYAYYVYAKETVTGFIMDWVVSPTTKILDTLRHGGDSSGLSIMSRESLNSDFDSLERMVTQFAKDQQKDLSPEQIIQVGKRVRQGDLSLVLGAYEQDLKSPLKSAVAGTLVRTLLIQVQKVKVDVDLAMDGIEKMLRSQQLTFAFVGVAPSMVLLYLVTGWAKRLFNVGESATSISARRKVWYNLRNVDRLLTTALDASEDKLSDQATGLLLIELTTLRQYANGPFFPTRDRSVRNAFLEDVRDLEADRGIKSRLRVFDRLIRVWERYVRV